MPKKPARNAFYFFMKDIEPALRKEGRVFPNGVQDLVPIAHPRWKVCITNRKLCIKYTYTKQKVVFLVYLVVGE